MIILAFTEGVLFFYLMVFAWVAIQHDKSLAHKVEIREKNREAFKRTLSHVNRWASNLTEGEMSTVLSPRMSKVLRENREPIQLTEVNNVPLLDTWDKEEFLYAVAKLPKDQVIQILIENEMYEQCAWINEQ